MTPSRARPGTAPQQTPQQIAAALEEFLAEHPHAVVAEDGRVLFDMRRAKYSLATDHGRCTLQLWDEERNLVRRISAVVERGAARDRVLRLTTHRFGQTRASFLDLLSDPDRRTPTTREATRTRYLRTLERAMLRGTGAHGNEVPTALKKPPGVSGRSTRCAPPWTSRRASARPTRAVLWCMVSKRGRSSRSTPLRPSPPSTASSPSECLRLADCRERAGGRRLYRGLRIVVPRGMGTLTLSRLAWMNSDAAQWELWEFDEKTEELTRRDAADHGNLATHLVHAPDQTSAHQRFAESAARVMALVPEAAREVVEQRIRSGAEMAFLLHGLEFARVRMGYAGQSFNRTQEVTFGAGANETPLTEVNAEELRELVARLCARRSAIPREKSSERPENAQRSVSDPLYRMQPERWLESVLRRDITAIGAHLSPAHVYTQVPAFAASDRGMLDLLSVDRDGRLAVIELKADDDLHLALQGLDYWIRVRWHHLQTTDTAGTPAFGLGEFQRHGYFPGVRLSPAPPRLYLVAPALRIHPATETVLRYLSPRVEWELVALNERWREEVKVVWRKRSTDVFR